jgi:hypothetical protein
MHLRDDAIKEYETTCDCAHKRLEELRTLERKRSLSLRGEYAGATLGGTYTSDEKKS